VSCSERILRDTNYPGFSGGPILSFRRPLVANTRAGAEFEGEKGANEKAWTTEADEAEEALDNAEVDNMHSSAKRPLEIKAVESSDPQEVVEEAESSAARLNELRQIREKALKVKVPGAVIQIDRELRQLERGKVQQPGKEAKLNQVLRRNLDAHFEAEAKAIQAKRAENFKLNRTRRKIMEANARKRKAEQDEKAKRDELKKKVAALPKEYTAGALGASTVAGAKARKECLDKLKMLSPPLAFQDEHEWPFLRDRWLTWAFRKYKAGLGLKLIPQLNETVEALGEHFGGKSDFKAKGKQGGDPDAFNKFRRELKDELPVSALKCTL